MSLLISMLLAATPTAGPVDASRDRCPKPAVTTDSARFHRLGDLPPAQASLAVLRSTDCPAQPVLARDRIGPVPKPSR